MIKITIKISDNSTDSENNVNIHLENFSDKELSKSTENEKTVALLVREKIDETLQNLTKKEE